MTADWPALAGLFAAAFLAATLLPAQSEAVLVGLLLTERYDQWLLLSIASIGNTAGSALNWLLGRLVNRLGHRRWLGAGEAQLVRAEAWYRRWGLWSLLLAWVPVVGDPLTLVAGLLRAPLLPFLAVVGLAKSARYLVLVLAAG